MHASLSTRLIVLALIPLAAALGPSPASAAENDGYAWPKTVVSIEDLRPTSRFHLQIRGLVEKGRITGPAVLRAHVDEAGAVVRVVLLESSGNGDLDEAAIHALREMTFKPYTVVGAPTGVSLVIPVHVPKRLGRTD